jgi:hypothetical protein
VSRVTGLITEEEMMGSLIPTDADREISAALNFRFSEAHDPNADPANPTPTMIGSVRWHNSQHEHLFDDRGLHRVAFRLIKAVPADQERRRRWYFLLRHPTSGDAFSDENRRDIKGALNVALNDPSIRQVKFAADHVGDIGAGGIATRFLVGSTISDEVSTADKKTKIKTLTITIHCQQDQRIPAAATEHDPPLADVPENGPIHPGAMPKK